MEVSDVEAVLEFLRKHGFSESEMALREDIIERNDVVKGDFDFERFLFPMVPPPPPVRVPSSGLLRRPDCLDGGDDCSRSSSEEFVSLESSSSNVCSSEFTNPYGIHSPNGGNSEASSDRLSAFGTAREYNDFDMQNDLYWYDEKDEGHFMTPCFNGSDPYCCPSEDKFVTTIGIDKPYENLLGLDRELEGFQSASSTYLEKPCFFKIASTVDENVKHEKGERELPSPSSADYRSSAPLCQCCTGKGGISVHDPENYSTWKSKECDLNDIQYKVLEDAPTDSYAPYELKLSESVEYSITRDSINNVVGDFKTASDLQTQAYMNNLQLTELDTCDVEDDREVAGDSREPVATAGEEDGLTADELLTYGTNEEEYVVFDLRIIHRKNRTGFEENKDLPIVLNTIIASRYYVTEYLGSAAFSRVVQAHDLHTGMDVCLKIIKNDKDFFDQSLDEIKLLKLVNKHDPADERHILRLYDFFYHQEHLFIVCELLRANLYEFQKFNQDSGGESYFTLSRLQAITQQCLEALEYLHHLGIIHCDLKPENILIKSYRKCEIKIIDLGSSCFQNDNLCLYVQSRSYRAPEVILGLPYNPKIDLWSLGCILAELCSGEVLFPNEALVVLLARMIGMLGPIDQDMLARGQDTDKYFTKEYDLYHMNEETNQLEYIIPEDSSLEQHLQISDAGFIDFVRCLLEINPERRPTAEEALQHPWLSHSY